MQEPSVRYAARVFALGPQLMGLGSQDNLDSTKTYFIEACVEDSELTALQDNLNKQQRLCNSKAASISTFTAQVATLTTEVGVLKTRIAALEKEKANVVYEFRGDVDKFSTVCSQMAIQTFIDHIISAVYVAASLEGTNPDTGVAYSDHDLVERLQSAKANIFFQGGYSMVVFDAEVALDGAFLTDLLSLRSIATSMSQRFVHTTKPVLVATVINNLLYREEDDIAKVFKKFFQCSFTEVVNKYKMDLLTKEQASRLKKKFSSKS